MRRIAISVVAALFIGCNCTTKAFLDTARDIDAKVVVPGVAVCPGEMIALVWRTENADSATIDNSIGSLNPVAAGFQRLGAPQRTTQFILTAAREECSESDRATIRVIRDKDQMEISAANSSKDSLAWSVSVLNATTSPAIVVTAMRLDDSTAALWDEWSLGRSSSVDERTVILALNGKDWQEIAEPFSIVGDYTISPVGGSTEIIPPSRTVGIIARVRCE
jgi:hypothetical protein